MRVIGRFMLVMKEFPSVPRAILALIILPLVTCVIELSAVIVCPRILFSSAHYINLYCQSRLSRCNLVSLISFCYMAMGDLFPLYYKWVFVFYVIIYLEFWINEFYISYG